MSNTQDSMITYAKNFVKDNLTNVTNEVINDYVASLNDMDGNEVFTNLQQDHTYVGWRVLKYIYQIGDTTNMLIDGGDYAFANAFGGMDYMDDMDLAEDIDNLFDSHNIQIYRVKKDSLVDIFEYFNAFGFDYQALNKRLITSSLINDVYVIMQTPVDVEDNDMAIITELNRSLFLGNDTYDSIHQPMFNHCAMFVYYQLRGRNAWKKTLNKPFCGH